MTRRAFVILTLLAGSWLPLRHAIARGEDAAIRQDSFDSAGVAIHYILAGPEDGEPVVLIHGFAGSAAYQWAKVIPSLAKKYRIIALDCRGHGQSGKPHDPAKYGAEMANDVARLLDHLKIERAHLVGYSMGAGIALSFAVHHPERLLSATLGGSSGLMRGEEQVAAQVADSLEKGNGFGPLLIALAPKDKPPTPEMIKLADKLVLSMNDPLALAAAVRGALADAISDKQAQDAKAPMIAVIGADDPLRAGVDHLKEVRPETKVVVIEHSDHMSAVGNPRFLAEAFKFIEENRSARK